MFLRASTGLSSKETACNMGAAGDASSIPESGRSPGGGYGNVENSMNRGALRATLHGVEKSRT